MKPCATCKGAGRVRSERTITVRIPKGVDDGTRLRLSGEGEASASGGPPGDLYVFLRVRPHASFRREDSNLHCEIDVTISQAALGTTVKVVMPTVLHDIAWRAMQVHGALGVTDDVPFMSMVTGAAVMGLADGPTEVHKATVAKQVLRDYQPSNDVWPTQWIPRKREAAREKFAAYLEHEVGNL